MAAGAIIEEKLCNFYIYFVFVIGLFMKNVTLYQYIYPLKKSDRYF